MSIDDRESLDYLFSRLDYERLGMPRSIADLRLGRTSRLLRALGDPQDALRIVHVAGTKGKGSTAAMIAASSQAAGLKTGLFTSPHLHRLEERFQVDGQEASAGDVDRLVDRIRPVVERLDRDDPHFRDRGGATFFEITTVMGLLHFAEIGTDLVVLEVGMGGRLDSTNAIHPVVSVITTISLDHTRLLGSTLAAIASEKAGIIKRGRPVVSGVIADEAGDVIRMVAQARSARLHSLGRDFHYAYHPPAPPLDRPKSGNADITTWRTNWGLIDLPLIGEHQALNASIALATLDVLAEEGIPIGRETVRRGFASMNWPARTEILGEHPWVVVDGAHNPASAEALADTLQACFPVGPRTLIFGTTREKDFRSQLEALLPTFARVICTRFRNNPRAVPPEDVAATVVSLGYDHPIVVDDPASAFDAALNATPAEGLICATGSLFLAGEIRAEILNRRRDASFSDRLPPSTR